MSCFQTAVWMAWLSKFTNLVTVITGAGDISQRNLWSDICRWVILIYAKFPNNNSIPVAGNWNRNRWWKYYWNQIRKHNQIDWNRIRNQKVYRNRWRWIQPRSGFNQSEMASGKYARVMWRFPSSSATARDGEVIQNRQHWRDNLSSRVKWCKNQTVRNVYMWMQQYLDLFRQNNFHVSYRRHMPATF